MPPGLDVCLGGGWLGSASAVSNDTPDNAFDRDADRYQSRFSTGTAMTVGQWYQVDFGQTLELKKLDLAQTSDDFARAFDVRLSDTPLNHAGAATLAGVAGVNGTTTVNLPGAAAGRYLLITLTSTGGSTKWWSIQDIAVECGDSGLPPGGGGGTGGTGGQGGTGGTSAQGGTGGQGDTGGQGGTGGTPMGDECVMAVDCDDANPCTDEACNNGYCSTVVDDTNACSDDDDCTTDVCDEGMCTSTDNGTCECDLDEDCVNTNGCLDVACVNNQCVTAPNTNPCTDDGNGCTLDVCAAGSCTHPGNTGASCSDGIACTVDQCSAQGACVSDASACECITNQDCTSDNACLDVACVDNQCVYTANSSPCADDGNPCTNDVCSEGSCGQNTGVCSSGNMVTIFANRTSQYVLVKPDSSLGFNAATKASAAIFEQVFDGSGLRFKLRVAGTQNYVGISAGSELLKADLTEAAGSQFGAPDCTPTTPADAARWVGLFAYGDDDPQGVIQTADAGLTANQANCPRDNTGAWEKFRFEAVAPGCKEDIDCDDGNACSVEACVDGYCSYAKQPDLTACADDGVACTSDVCSAGVCSHVDDGTCGTGVIVIRTNRDNKYFTLNPVDSFVEWSATVIGSAARFEQVDMAGNRFKLRAENGSFIKLGNAQDELVAAATYAEATLFEVSTCGTLSGIAALDDMDDGNRFLKADVARIRASNANCPDSPTAWEKFEILPAP